MHVSIQPTTDELKSAFKLSGLWRRGWTYERAIHTVAVFIGLCNTVTAIRKKYQTPTQPCLF